MWGFCRLRRQAAATVRSDDPSTGAACKDNMGSIALRFRQRKRGVAMANLDRLGIVELLGRLGAQDDATVLATARELHAKVSQSGLTWNELLRANLDVADADAEHEDALGDETEAPAEQEGELSAADKAEVLRLLDRLLARKGLSSTLRGDLADLKRGIADGSFDAMDSRYVRALAKRLGV
jgi:hypothetical protein